MKATKENNLLKKFPEIAKQWHPTKNGKLKPSYTAPHSGKKIWWMCSPIKKHVWKASPDTRSKGHGCPKCYLEKRYSIKQ